MTAPVPGARQRTHLLCLAAAQQCNASIVMNIHDMQGRECNGYCIPADMVSTLQVRLTSSRERPLLCPKIEAGGGVGGAGEGGAGNGGEGGGGGGVLMVADRPDPTGLSRLAWPGARLRHEVRKKEVGSPEAAETSRLKSACDERGVAGCGLQRIYLHIACICNKHLQDVT
jgi:hypothetical protein